MSSAMRLAVRPAASRRGWGSEAGMEWIKRRGGNSDDTEGEPVKRRWEKTGFSWLKRSDGDTPNLSKHADENEQMMTVRRRDAADIWAREVTSPRTGLHEEISCL